MEMLAVAAILGVIAGIIVPRLTGGGGEAQKAACETHQGNIEIQAELWKHDTGAWPASNLSDMGADAAYFPSGLPACPVDGTAYTIGTTGRVIGHSH